MHRFTEPTPVPSSVEIIFVFVENWEIECCGTPPVAGFAATWTLGFREAESPFSRRLPNGARWEPTTRVVTAGGINAFWPNAQNIAPENARGYFWGTLHPGPDLGEVEPTTGNVVGVLLRTMEYRNNDGIWQPVAGTDILRRIERSPKWFSHDPHTSPYMETGVVVELEVERSDVVR